MLNGGSQANVINVQWKENMSAILQNTGYGIDAGDAHPVGATPDENGTNFSIYSSSATSVELLLFDLHDSVEPAQIIQLDHAANKTFNFWHVYVRGVGAGTHYAYRIDGPYDPQGRGHRFNKAKVVIDPYAKGVTDARVVRSHALRNALLPMITLGGLAFPALFGGAVFVERIYSWPGMGLLMTNAVYSRDYPLVLASVLVAALVVVIGSALADIGYALADPRIRVR